MKYAFVYCRKNVQDGEDWYIMQYKQLEGTCTDWIFKQGVCYLESSRQSTRHLVKSKQSIFFYKLRYDLIEYNSLDKLLNTHFADMI